MNYEWNPRFEILLMKPNFSTYPSLSMATVGAEEKVGADSGSLTDEWKALTAHESKNSSRHRERVDAIASTGERLNN